MADSKAPSKMEILQARIAAAAAQRHMPKTADGAVILPPTQRLIGGRRDVQRSQGRRQRDDAREMRERYESAQRLLGQDAPIVATGHVFIQNMKPDVAAWQFLQTVRTFDEYQRKLELQIPEYFRLDNQGAILTQVRMALPVLQDHARDGFIQAGIKFDRPGLIYCGVYGSRGGLTIDLVRDCDKPFRIGMLFTCDVPGHHITREIPLDSDEPATIDLDRFGEVREA